MDSKENKVINKNSETLKKVTKSISDFLIHYIQNNLIKFLSICILCFGGWLLLVFFININYMPEISIESITSIIYAVAILGLVLFIYSLLFITLPGLFLSYEKQKVTGVSKWHIFILNVDAALIWFLIISLQLCEFTTINKKTFIILIATIIIILFILSMLLSNKQFFKKYSEQKKTYVTKLKKSDIYHVNINRKQNFLWSLTIISVTTISYAMCIFSISFFWLNGSINTENDYSFIFKSIYFIFLIILSTTFIGSLKFPESLKFALALSPLLLFIILFLTKSFSTFSLYSIKILRLGEVNSTRIVVSGKTCQTINYSLGKKVCEGQSDDSVTAICPVLIKSRIGNEMVLEFAPLYKNKSKENNKWNNFFWITTKNTDNRDRNIEMSQIVILDKSKILSWQPLARIKEKDFNDIEKTSSEKNTASASSAPTASEPAANSADNDTLKLVTLYDAKQKISAGTASDIDEFLLKHCREDTDEFNNKNPTPNK
ncbi:MAG: hypothetical protein J6570_04295 [Snodgrassella sp.]|nr:hypothetical protein [Snodgrassella sp.]